jgi:hypothetical protein
MYLSPGKDQWTTDPCLAGSEKNGHGSMLHCADCREEIGACAVFPVYVSQDAPYTVSQLRP